MKTPINVSARTKLLSLLLAGGLTLAGLVMLEGFAGRFLFCGDSFRATPNASYTFTSDAFSFQVRLNSDGFRDAEFPRHKPPGEKRLLFIGDSMTFGWGVEAAQSFVRQTEALLHEEPDTTAWRAFNLGIEGTAPFEYRDVLAGLGPELQPDMIVLCYYTGNDGISEAPPRTPRMPRRRLPEKIARCSPEALRQCVNNRVLPRFFRKPAPPHAFPGGQSPNPLTALLARPEEELAAWRARLRPDTLERALAWRINPFLVACSYTRASLLQDQINQYQQTLSNPAGRSIFAELCDLAQALGAEARLIIISPAYTTRQEAWPFMQALGYETAPALLHEDRFERLLSQMARERGVPLFALRDHLMAAESSPFFTEDPHLTPAGHRLVAETIAPWLAEAAPADHAPAPAPMARPPEATVQQWDFSGQDACGWRLGEARLLPEKDPQSLTLAAVKHPLMLTCPCKLDTEKINRVRFRCRSEKGVYAAFYWGRRQGCGESGYPFAPERCAMIPLLSDGQFHEYVFELDTATAYWEGAWEEIRLDPCAAHATEYSMADIPVSIDWIRLGYAVNPH